MRTIPWLSGILALVPAVAHAQQVVYQTHDTVRVGGVSALWVLANISYAGMRAQVSTSTGWRIVSFIVGFPGTLLSLLAVQEGGERAYGIDIPKKRL